MAMILDKGQCEVALCSSMIKIKEISIEQHSNNKFYIVDCDIRRLRRDQIAAAFGKKLYAYALL